MVDSPSIRILCSRRSSVVWHRGSVANESRNPGFEFLGSTFIRITLDKPMEQREIDSNSVAIGLKNDEWHYIMTPRAIGFDRMDIAQIESIVDRLPELTTIDIADLLSDQRLAKELLSSDIIKSCGNFTRLSSYDASSIIAKHCIGLGPIEDILSDELVEDVIISAPCSENRVFVATRLSDPDLGSIYCRSNLVLSADLLRSLVNRICVFHNKEMNLSSPILETEIPYLNARISAADCPASPQGLSLSIRRRTGYLWTLPRLISLGSIGWTAAGFLSLCCAAKGSIIVAGGRGSGKTTLLSALIPELPSTGRVIIMEDTPELPVISYQKENMSIQRLSIEGDLQRASSVMRAALRMGEGPIVVGEIRGSEAKILFESIRTGTASSSVIGTLHASDADSFSGRVIFDMGIDGNALDSVEVVVFVSHRKDRLTGGYLRHVSEICSFVKDDDRFVLKPIFRFDDSGKSKIGTGKLEDFGRLQAKFSSYLGLAPNEMLRASRVRGFVKLLQANEYLKHGMDWIIDVFTTRSLNKIPVSEILYIEPDELKQRVINVIHGGEAALER